MPPPADTALVVRLDLSCVQPSMPWVEQIPLRDPCVRVVLLLRGSVQQQMPPPATIALGGPLSPSRVQQQMLLRDPSAQVVILLRGPAQQQKLLWAIAVKGHLLLRGPVQQ